MTLNKIRRVISFGLFLIALAFIIPDGTTEIFLNVPLANWLSSQFNLSGIFSLFLTYTLIPIILIYLSAFIHPKDTDGMFHSLVRKVKDKLDDLWHKSKKNPLIAVIILIILYITITKFISKG